MAGKVVVSTLNNDTGVLATQNGMTGIAKAWVNFTGSTGAINGSFNVSSVTRSATGTYQVNYTTAMPNINYVIFGATQQDNTIVTGANTALTTGSTSIFTRFCSSAALTDSSITTFAVLSS